MQPVGVGRRAVAVIIDSILLFVLGYVIAAMTGGTTREGFEITGAPALIWFAIALAYYVVMEKTWGATLGKKVMNLKVVKQDGAAIDWQAAIVRNVLRIIDGFFFYLVGAIVVWISKSKQRLGDMAAHTIVVSSRVWLPAMVALAAAGFMPGESHAGPPRYTDLVLSDAKEGNAKATFKPDTPKIFLRSKLVDMPSGTRLKADWVAVKVVGAPPNYTIDTTELKTGAMTNLANFSFSKPNAGWPVGDYRVDLFVDGKPATKVPFKVVK
jgi:uncharacterized RDD family membrane protein YckC